MTIANHGVMIDVEGSIPIDTLLKHANGAAGYSSHNRAKCPPRDYGKSLVARGGLYFIVFEDGARGLADGYDANVARALFANKDADDQGYPLDRIIVPTADYAAHVAEVSEGLRAWHEHSVRPLGLYGDGELIRFFKRLGWIRTGWFTCSGSFPGSNDPTGEDIKQRCQGESDMISIPGYSIDTNYLLTAGDLGIWGQQPATPPVPRRKPFEPMAWPGKMWKLNDRDATWVPVIKVFLTALGHKIDTSTPTRARTYGTDVRDAVKSEQALHEHDHPEALWYPKGSGRGPDGVMAKLTWDWLNARLVLQSKALIAGVK